MADDDHLDLNDIVTPLDRRAATLVDDGTTPFELVANLEEQDLPMPAVDQKSRSPYPIAALVRVFPFHELFGVAIDAILDRLEINPKDAAAFGFEDIPDKYNARGVPDQSRLSRAKNDDRFGETYAKTNIVAIPTNFCSRE